MLMILQGCNLVVVARLNLGHGRLNFERLVKIQVDLHGTKCSRSHRSLFSEFVFLFFSNFEGEHLPSLSSQPQLINYLCCLPAPQE